MTFELRDAIVRHEGFEKGKAKGKTENTILIAKNLLNMNFKIEDIAKSTGLSTEEILKLKKYKQKK